MAALTRMPIPAVLRVHVETLVGPRTTEFVARMKRSNGVGTNDNVSSSVCYHFDSRCRYATAESQSAETPSNCTDCEAGTFSAAVGLSDASQCSRCPQGRWGNKKGQTDLDVACAICQGGTYSLKKGHTSSTCSGVCVPGKYSLPGLSSCKCTRCTTPLTLSNVFCPAHMHRIITASQNVL